MWWAGWRSPRNPSWPTPGVVGQLSGTHLRGVRLLLTLRGLRTLAPRLRAHQENTDRILAFLQQQPLVKRIYHPSLPSHPGHDIARRQQSGFGAMLSFELDCNEAGIRAFLAALTLFSVAESLGGVESLVAHPASMTHRAMTPCPAGGRHQQPAAASVGRYRAR